MTTNLTEFRQILGAQPKSIAQLISTVNSLRANTKAYVRVWRPEPAFQLEGADFPDPPPSVAMILAGSQTAQGSITPDAQFQNRGIGNRRRRQRHQRIEDDPGGGEGMRHGAASTASRRRARRRRRGPAVRRRRALASATTAWEMTSYQDFIRGQFQGVSLSRDGRLTLAPKVDTLFSSGQAVVWSVAEGANGVLYVATGHRGRVYQVDPVGRQFPALDRRTARSLRHRHRSQRRAVRRHFARWQGLSHRKRQSHRVLRSQDPLHLVAGHRARWRAVCGHRRSGQDLPRDLRGQGRALLRYRPIARHRPGRGCARPPAGRHRAERHSLSRIGQGQGLRALRRQPARDPRHHSAARWHRLCGRAGRLAGQARAGRRAGRSVRNGRRGHRAGRAPSVTVEAQNTQPGAEIKAQPDPTKQTQPRPRRR